MTNKHGISDRLDLAIFLKVFDDLFDRLFALLGNLRNVTKQIGIGNADFFCLCDFLEEEIGAEVGDGALGGDGEDFLLLFEDVFIGCALSAALLDEGVCLVLDFALHDFLRKLEADGGVEFLDDLGNFKLIDLLGFLHPHVLTNDGFDLVEGFSRNEFFCELIVQLRELRGFDILDGGVQDDGFATEFFERKCVV